MINLTVLMTLIEGAIMRAIIPPEMQINCFIPETTRHL